MSRQLSRASDAVTVRPARGAEIEVAGALTAQAYLADDLVETDGWYRGVLADAASRAAEAELLVAADEHRRVLGTVTVAENASPYAEVARPGELEFRMLAVDPAARGRGIGELLTRAVLDQARQRGRRAVVLSSSVRMHVAHRLYRRLGFRRLPERDWSPVPGTPLLVFTLELGAGPDR